MTFLTGSTDLKRIIERHGWSLYDVTRSPARIEPISWKELGKLSPAPGYELSHTYLFMPLATAEKNLLTLYNELRAEESPVLSIPRKSKFKATGTDAYSYRDLQMYYLSELCFRQQDVFAFSNHLVYPNYSPTLHIPYPEVIELFDQCFSMVSSDDSSIKFKLSKQGILN